MLTVNPDHKNRKRRGFKINPLLDENAKDRIMKLLYEYNDVFADYITEIGPTNLIQHKIKLEVKTYFKSKPYTDSPTERKVIGR